jgi:hypothetical protein
VNRKLVAFAALVDFAAVVVLVALVVFDAYVELVSICLVLAFIALIAMNLSALVSMSLRQHRPIHAQVAQAVSPCRAERARVLVALFPCHA